ncbi:MAG: 30S ribosomal protein S20 [Deltaproteobacteria bacterium]|nr:30S ribosomal protein S20 [Deltaproteobacteria bacterium]
MAQHKQSEKRARQAQKIQANKKSFKTVLVKAVRDLKAQTKKKEALALLPNTIATVDKSASHNIIHRKKAARYKSRLTRFVNTLK